MSGGNLPEGSLFQRSIKLCFLSIKLCFAVLRNVRKGDVVLTVTNPAPLIVMIAILRKFVRFRLLLLVHDVFPENAVALGIMRKHSRVFLFFKKVFDKAYRSTDVLISIGRDMNEVLVSKLKGSESEIVLIENWADDNLETAMLKEDTLRGKLSVSDRIVFQYAGNIGRAQGCVEFLHLISALENPNIQFNFRGSGVFYDRLKDSSQSMESVCVGGSYSRADEALISRSCDIGLVMLHENMFGLGVPSKAYNILASGKPILFLGPTDSEIYRLVKENNVGWAFSWSRAGELLDFLGHLTLNDLPEIQKRGNLACKLAKTKYNKQLQMQKYDELIQSVLK